MVGVVSASTGYTPEGLGSFPNQRRTPKARKTVRTQGSPLLRSVEGRAREIVNSSIFRLFRLTSLITSQHHNTVNKVEEESTLYTP